MFECCKASETFNSKVWTISFVWIWMVQGRSLVATFRPVWRVCFSLESSIINQLLRQQIGVFGFYEDLAFGFTGQTIYVSGVVPWQHLDHCKRFACFRPYTYVYMYSCAAYILPYSPQVSTSNVAITRTFDARLDLTCESADACTSAEIWRHFTWTWSTHGLKRENWDIALKYEAYAYI